MTLLRPARRRARLAPVDRLYGLAARTAPAARAVVAVFALFAAFSPPRPAAAAAPAGPGAAAMHVAFAPDRPGARTTIELSLRVEGGAPGGLGGGAPEPLQSFALRLPAGMGIATATLGEANCTTVALLARGLAGCPADARLGYGSATAIVPAGSRTVAERAALYPLMGPPSENRVEVLFYAQASAPVFAQLVLPATLAEDVPPFGERLEAAVPLVQAWPEGPDLSLRTFSSTLGPLHLIYTRRVGGRTVAFHPRGIRIPASCPKGGYPFAALLRYADGTSASVSYRVPCGRH